MNVASALEVLSRETIDVLLSDIGLPDGSGCGLMERAKLVQPLIGIALSGFGTAEDISNATEAGFSHHLIKPIDFNQLETVLVRLTSNELFQRAPAEKKLHGVLQQVS
jgi:DNA-binding NtrC family response regulator